MPTVKSSTRTASTATPSLSIPTLRAAATAGALIKCACALPAIPPAPPRASAQPTPPSIPCCAACSRWASPARCSPWIPAMPNRPAIRSAGLPSRMNAWTTMSCGHRCRPPTPPAPPWAKPLSCTRRMATAPRSSKTPRPSWTWKLTRAKRWCSTWWPARQTATPPCCAAPTARSATRRPSSNAPRPRPSARWTLPGRARPSMTPCR